jgi:hypothetical protein
MGFGHDEKLDGGRSTVELGVLGRVERTGGRSPGR